MPRKIHSFQADICAWAKININLYPELEMIWIHTEGNKHNDLPTPIPSIILHCPAGQYHGLLLFLKWQNKKPTPEQCEWSNRFVEYGYMVRTYDSAEVAIDCIKKYLKLGTLKRGRI